MNALVTICIPTRTVWNGICLTIESIRKRSLSAVKIIVCDNSLSENSRSCEPPVPFEPFRHPGHRREYLDRALREGTIDGYIRHRSQGKTYGHGDNIRLMLERVDTPFAMLFNSTSEILRPDWVDSLIYMIDDPERDLGVARFRAGGARDHDYIMPCYWPNMMLLYMPLLRRFFPENDWSLDQIGLESFDDPQMFQGEKPKHPERTPPLVFCDTGWKLTRKLSNSESNPNGVRMLPLPDNYWNTYIKWLGGIDRNSHRPEHPFVVETLAEIDRRLKALRAE